MYDHHGIYTGEHRPEVIHFSGDRVSDASIMGSSLEEFLNRDDNENNKCRLVAYNVDPLSQLFKRRPGTNHGILIDCYPPETVVAIAKIYWNDPDRWIREHGKYNLHSNNCEHFAHFCKTGKFQSKQSGHGRSTVDIITDVIPIKFVFNSHKYFRQLSTFFASNAVEKSS